MRESLTQSGGVSLSFLWWLTLPPQFLSALCETSASSAVKLFPAELLGSRCACVFASDSAELASSNLALGS